MRLRYLSVWLLVFFRPLTAPISIKQCLPRKLTKIQIGAHEDAYFWIDATKPLKKYVLMTNVNGRSFYYLHDLSLHWYTTLTTFLLSACMHVIYTPVSVQKGIRCAHDGESTWVTTAKKYD